MDSKPWWQSKTVWFNVALGLTMLANQAADLGIPPAWAAWAAFGGNLILRVFTDKPVST